MQILSSLIFLYFSVSLGRSALLNSRSDPENTQISTDYGPGYSRGGIEYKRTQGHCQPFYTVFSHGTVSHSSGDSPFVSVSPPGSYKVSGDGLEMFLTKPAGPIVRHGHVNNVIAGGATINSTFLVHYGKVTFEMQSPAVAGSVTAAILISDGHDEIDVEILGGDVAHWQTNVYAPSPEDKQPLWGVFGEVHNVYYPPSVEDFHNYTIDWTEERIIWSVNGREVRTLKPSETSINGTLHYPNQPSRIQLGIWDASSPEGTSEWAKGPINWQDQPSSISATVKSVSVECH